MRRLLSRLALVVFAPLYLAADAHIFVYHRFDDLRHSSTSTSLEVLKAQFEYLKQNNYKVIKLSRLVDALEKKEPIDNRWVVLSIDDSYRSFYDNALPLFKEYGYPFTLFVYTEATDKNYGDFMSWEQIKVAAQYGEIGNHGDSHAHLTHLSSKEISQDLNRSIDSFVKHLGFRPKYYAYAYGEYDQRVQKQIRQHNFKAILNQTNGAISNSSNIYDLNRFALTGENTLKSKLRVKRLDVEWVGVEKFVQNGKLTTIYAKISPKFKRAQLYISGYGWRDIEVRDGLVKYRADLKLKLSRTRIFLKVANMQQGILFVKEKR